MEKFPSPENIELVTIAEELIRMFASDQEMRGRAINNDGIIESEEDANLDKVNTDRLKEIVDKYGWPTVSKVGERASRAAFFLVQHADHDVAWQKKCLGLMRAEPRGEVSEVDIAYLTDRVRVNEGKPQVYGTQFWEHEGVYGPRPIEDSEHVDDRRKEIGLESMTEYEASLRKRYNIK